MKKIFLSFLLSITLALNLNYPNIYPAITEPNKKEGTQSFDPANVFDQIIEQNDQEQLHNAAFVLSIMESLFECFLSEKLAAPYNLDSSDWDQATTDLLNTLYALYEKMNPDVKDAFQILDAHFAKTDSKFNFPDFIQLINIRRKFAILFWEYANTFKQFKQEVSNFLYATENAKVDNPKSLEKLRELCKMWQMDDCSQSILAKIASSLDSNTEYLDIKIISSEIKKILTSQYRNFSGQFMPVEKKYKVEFGELTDKIYYLGSSVKNAAEQFFSFYDTIAETFPKIQQDYPSIYKNATYFKRTSALLYKKLFAALNPANLTIKYINSSEQTLQLPTEIFLINSILEQKNLEQSQTLLQSLSCILELKANLSQITKVQQQNPHAKVCITLSNAHLFQLVCNRYHQFTMSHVNTKNPSLFEQISSFRLWAPLHALLPLNFESYNRMNILISSTVEQLRKEPNETKSKIERRLTILTELLLRIQGNAKPTPSDISNWKELLTPIIREELSHEQCPTQKYPYDANFKVFSIPANHLWPTMEYYEQLVRQHIEYLRESQQEVQTASTPKEQKQQSSSQEQHKPKKSVKTKTKKLQVSQSRAHLTPSSITTQSLEQQEDAQTSSHVSPTEKPEQAEVVIPQKRKSCEIHEKSQTHVHKPTRSQASPQGLSDYLNPLLSLPLFNYDYIKDETGFVAIRQSHGGPWGNGMMLIIYKEQDNPHITQAPFTTYQLDEKPFNDSFHNFSDQVKRFFRYGIDIHEQALSTTAGIHQLFIEQLHPFKNERIVILRGKIINDSYYRYERAMQDKNICRPGMHDGAFVFIYNPETGVCKHQCFHETQASYKANHQ